MLVINFIYNSVVIIILHKNVYIYKIEIIFLVFNIYGSKMYY